jgi:hypothetical protein
MRSEWGAVDTLIRELGAAVSAATYVRGSIERATADLAIREASEAVNQIISAPGNRALIATAREAIHTAQSLILALDTEVARSRALRATHIELRGRALELLEQARRARRPLP